MPFFSTFCKTPILAFSVKFISAFLGWNELEGLKGSNANDVSYGLDAIVSSYRRAVARSEESMPFASLFPLSHEKENPDV